ncbi:MAG: PEGA domain-containing protein [Methanoregula sp.]|nr:PEGA domain-containing protein [Methanoregula sp.]
MRLNRFFWVLVLLIAAICIIQPVLGVNGTVTIAYRGSGGSYIGDTIIFDGKNTVGNVTFLRINGPGLPAEGVPIYDLNGIPGAGNPIEVNPDGTWKIVWYTSSIKGIEKMQTARYTLTAADLAHPEISSTAQVFMKKPEFYANLTPNPATNADYVSLTGSVEQGVSYVRIDITDNAGKIYRTYSSPVSASGYFNYGFHVDMQPGQYYITVSNPSLKNPLQMVLIVLPPRTPTYMTTVAVSSGNTTSITASIPPSAATTQNLPGIPAGTGTISIASTPAGSSVYLDSVMMGKTPVDLGNINYGSHLVEIKSPGYQTYSMQVTVKDESPVILSPVLQKSTSSIPLSPVTALIGLIITGAIALVWKRT